jgi:hypothetical protein
MPNITKEANVKGLGSIIYCGNAPFDESLSAVKSEGARIITLSELAYARTQNDKEHSLSQNGSYVKEGSLFIPNTEHKRYLLRNSLVLKDPKSAVEAHRNGKEYFLAGNFNADEFLKKLKKNSYLVLDDLTPIPTDRFGEDQRTVWCFGKYAKDYGLFLKDAKIEKTGFYLYTNNDSSLDAQKQPFANQLWLHWLGVDSGIGGNDSCLSNSNWVRGVQSEKTAEGGRAEKIKLPSLEQVLSLADSYVPAAARADFEKKLRKLYK